MERTCIPAADAGAGLLMRVLFPLLTLAFLSGGCQAPTEPLPYPITLSPEGLGPVRPGLSFDIAALQSKLPGFTVEKMSQITPERSQILFTLKRGDAVMAYIFPDEQGKRIGHISVVTERIPDHNGQKVGDPIHENPSLRCAGDECRYETHPSLSYRLAPSSRIIREITLQKL